MFRAEPRVLVSQTHMSIPRTQYVIYIYYLLTVCCECGCCCWCCAWWYGDDAVVLHTGQRTKN